MDKYIKGKLVLLEVERPMIGMIAFHKLDGHGEIIVTEGILARDWVFCLPIVVTKSKQYREGDAFIRKNGLYNINSKYDLDVYEKVLTDEDTEKVLVNYDQLSDQFKLAICVRRIKDGDEVSVKTRKDQLKLKAEDGTAIISKYVPDKLYSEEDVLHILAMLTYQISNGRMTYKEMKEWWNCNKNSKALWNREQDKQKDLAESIL
jgi:hypothetical protein